MQKIDKEKYQELMGQVLDIVKKQDEQRETLRTLVESLCYQMRKNEELPMTVDEWEKARTEALWAVGLGPMPFHVRIRQGRGFGG